MMHVDPNELKKKFGEEEPGFALGSLYIWLGFIQGGLGLIFETVGLVTDAVPSSLKGFLTGVAVLGVAFLLRRRKQVGLYANYVLLTVGILSVLTDA